MVLSSPPNIMPSELASERTDGEHGDERNQLQRDPHNLAKVTVRRGKCTPFSPRRTVGPFGWAVVSVTRTNRQ